MNYERKVLEKRWPPEKRRASMSFLLGYSRDARERKGLEDFAPERRLRCWVSQQSVLMMATFPFPGLSVRSSVSHSPFLFSLLSKRSVLFPPCAVVLYIVFLTPPKHRFGETQSSDSTFWINKGAKTGTIQTPRVFPFSLFLRRGMLHVS